LRIERKEGVKKIKEDERRIKTKNNILKEDERSI
jgi:hypothetical protein